MAEFSVIMSDDAAPATCTSRLVTFYVRELKEAGFTVRYYIPRATLILLPNYRVRM